MKGKISKIIWGIVAILVGVAFALKVLDIVDFNIFFKGWWTLFIIVPCFIGLICDKDKFGNFVGLLIGTALLLAARDIIEFSTLWKLALPVALILLGIKLVFGGIFGGKSAKRTKELKSKISSDKVRSVNGIFSGADLKVDGEVFEGAELNAIFGGVECDLRGAVIEGDCFIDVSSIFGGADIIVPEGINVKINSTSIFGGASEKREFKHDKLSPTLYVNAICIFGGVDIK